MNKSKKWSSRLAMSLLLVTMLVMSVAGIRTASAAPANGILGQNLPPGPTAIYQSKLPLSGMAGEFDLVNLILEFAPGSATPSHTHGGPGIITVLEGEVTWAAEGQAEKTFKVGESFVESPGEYAIASNKGASKARASVLFALPKGAALTTPKGGTPTANPPPGPTTVSRTTLPGITVSGDFELTNLILNFAPGSATPPHAHGARLMVTVLEGELSNAVEGKTEQMVKAGESFIEVPGEYAVVGNKSTANARVSVVVALPKGVPLTTVKGAAGQTFNGIVGHEIFTEEGQKSSWQANRFYPENITVNVGDSINWKFDSGVEPHTVSFLSGSKFPDFVTPECNGAPCPPPPPGGGGGPPPPGVTIKLRVSPVIAFPQGGNSYDGTGIVSSGIVASDIPGPKAYSLSFTKPGTYTFVCLVHAFALPDGTVVGMQGKVTVQAAGSSYPKTNAQVQAEAQAMMAADEQEARAAEPEAKTKMVTTRPGANGTTVHHVNSGYEIFKPTYTIDYMRFAPNDININVGDTVEWSSPTPHSFHNVLFGEEPEALLVEPQPAGPPKLYFNTKVALPSGGPDYAGSGLYSAGIIVGPEDPPQAGAPGYALTFSASGRFEYICALHYHNGMDGHVTVAARTGGGQPGMPTTGNPDNWSVLVALMAALAATLAGTTLRLRVLVRRNVVK